MADYVFYAVTTRTTCNASTEPEGPPQPSSSLSTTMPLDKLTSGLEVPTVRDLHELLSEVSMHYLS